MNSVCARNSDEHDAAASARRVAQAKIVTRRQADMFSVPLMLVYMTASLTLSAPAVVTGELQTGFGLSDAQIGLLTSVFMGSFAVAGLLSGLFASRWGGRLLALTCGCFVVGSAILGLSSSFAGFLVGRAIQGIGGGTVVCICNPLIARTLPANRTPRCWGIFGCGWGLGQMATLLIMPSVDRVGGYKAVFLTAAFLAAAAGAFALSQRLVRAIPRDVAEVARLKTMAVSLWTVARNPRLLLLSLTCTANLAVGVGVLVWTPSFLQDHRSASLAVAAYLTAGLGASQVLGNLVGAAAAGRWNGRAVILASLAGLTAAVALIAVVPGQVLPLIVVLIAGFCGEILFPPMMAYISEVVARPEHVGPATGVHTVMGFTGSLIAPWIFGLTLDAGGRSGASYLSGYLILALFAVAALVGMAFFRSRSLAKQSGRPIHSKMLPKEHGLGPRDGAGAVALVAGRQVAE